MAARAGAGSVIGHHAGMLAASLAATDWASIPSWVAVASVVAFAFVLLRGGSGQAVEGLQATNRELQRQITVLQEQVHELTRENAELKGRTDVTVAIAPLLEWSANHEKRAQERHEGTLKILDLIAGKFGEENGP